MTDTNTNEVEVKAVQIELDVPLFQDTISDEMVFTDKRFPGGRIRIYMPVPELTIDEEADDALRAMYNKGFKELLSMGIRQNAYGERDWDILKKEGEPADDEGIIANIERAFGPLNGMDVEKVREFFEAAVFSEAKERKTSVEKATVKKLKAAGLGAISDEEIAALIAMRNSAA